MRELPIIFNTEMVRAILDGRKTQSRRLIKSEYDISVYNYSEKINGKYLIDDCFTSIEVTPHCRIGDKLYVRETFSLLFSQLLFGESIDLNLSICSFF